MSFVERINDRIERLGTRLCIGLDPRTEWHPEGVDLWSHCSDILEACEPHACAVKPQLAFFEALGLEGLQTLYRLLDLARSMELPVIIDAKRGDIGSTAEAYAQAWLRGEQRGGALTVNPYLGRDSLQPFVDAAIEEDGALFCLVKTSNPGAGDLQDLEIDEEGHKRTVALEITRWIGDWNDPGEGSAKGYGPVGAVVGATRPAELHAFRQALPRSLLLLPGVGAQGGKPADLAPAFHPGGQGAIVAVSRAVEYASRKSDFAIAARGSAKELKEAINAACAVPTRR